MDREEQRDLYQRLDGVDEDDVNRLLEKYDYPGELMTDVYTYFGSGDFEPEIPLDCDLHDLYHSLRDEDVTFHTGKQSERPRPSDIYEEQFVDGGRKRYNLLGRDVDNIVYFFREIDPGVEIRKFDQDLEGVLEERGDSPDRMRHSPWKRLRHYLGERQWDLVEEPEQLRD